MYVLGINISHHCSVCLIKDGDIIFFLEEERLSKFKYHYPAGLLRQDLLRSYYNESEKEQIYDRYFLPRLKTLEKIPGDIREIDHIIFTSTGDESDIFVINSIIDQIKENFLVKTVHYYHEHHLYHACSAFYNSGFNNALAIVLDGGGYQQTKTSEKFNLLEIDSMFHEQESIYTMDYGNINAIFKHYARNDCLENQQKNYTETSLKTGTKQILSNSLSCGGIFNVVSHMLGFNGSTAGKTMGLAAYGNCEDISENWFTYDEQNNIWITDTSAMHTSFSTRSNMPLRISDFLNNDGIRKIDERQGADIAKKAQMETLDHTIRLIDRFTKETRETNVVLSGGYFLNCSNNYEYLKKFPNLNFFIDPIAHDGGTAIGASKYLWHKLSGDTTVRKLETLYLGT